MPRWKGGSFLVVGLCVIGMAGCAYPISKEWRQLARKDLAFSAVLQDATLHVGSIVIWGGVIVSTENDRNGADVIVLETPLDSSEMPEAAESSQGRFIARSSIFLDPAVYAPGRKITVAGEITGKTARQIGQRDYNYPVIAIKQIYLWPIRILLYYSRPHYYWEDGNYYDPWWPHRGLR
jgi:outer membrane lipoprotein